MNSAQRQKSHNVITKEAARIIFNKVEASNVPIAIFAANGSWNATKVSAQNFSRQMEAIPEKLVAIYDLNSRLQWIEDDLAAAGIR